MARADDDAAAVRYALRRVATAPPPVARRPSREFVLALLQDNGSQSMNVGFRIPSRVDTEPAGAHV